MTVSCIKGKTFFHGLRPGTAILDKYALSKKDLDKQVQRQNCKPGGIWYE